MEGSSEITIEFLRSRLWSERSVSRCARQRADELEKRVAELEEQLKVVYMQRRKAEKATADVLAILESNDISEAFDSGSDRETTGQSKFGSTFIKVDENSVKLRVRRNDSGDFSGSDHDFSPVSGRSLSWKGRKNTQSSPENHKKVFMKGRSSFKAVDSSSSKRRHGKLCRQIRQRDSRTMIDFQKTDRVKINLQENEVAISSKVIPENMEDGPVRESSEIQVDKDLSDGPHVSCSENGRNKTSGELRFHGYEKNEDLESALEYQTRLVGGDEAMEKDQREWEEKFREKNSSTQDLCDLGNHSDVTEETEEVKTQPHHPSCTISFQVQEARAEVEPCVGILEELSETQPKTKSQSNSFATELSETQPKIFSPPLHDDTRYLQGEKYQDRASESMVHDFAFPITKEKQNDESLGSNNHMPSHTPHHDLHQRVSNENHSAVVFSSISKSSSTKVEPSDSQNELYALVPEKTTSGSDAVLSALLQAKVSLQQKMAALTSASLEVRSVPKARSVGNTMVPFDPTRQAADKVQISVGCGGLFRVPQFSPETTKLNISSFANNYPITTFGVNTGFGLHTNSLLGTQIPSPYMDARSGFSSSTTSSYPSSPYITDGRLGPHAKNESRTSTKKLDHYSNASLQPTSQYIQPAVSAHRNMITRVPSNEGSRSFFSSAGLPPTDNFSFHQ